MLSGRSPDPRRGGEGAWGASGTQISQLREANAQAGELSCAGHRASQWASLQFQHFPYQTVGFMALETTPDT